MRGEERGGVEMRDAKMRGVEMRGVDRVGMRMSRCEGWGKQE